MARYTEDLKLSIRTTRKTGAISLPRVDVSTMPATVRHQISLPSTSPVPSIKMMGAYSDSFQNLPFNVPTFGRAFLEVKNATIYGASNLVTTKDWACHLQLEPRNEQILEAYSCNVLEGWDQKQILINRSLIQGRSHIKSAISLIGPYSQQWGHWCIDYVCRILSFNDAGGAPVLVTKELPPNARELIRILLNNPDIIEVADGQAIDVGHLLVPLSQTFCPEGWTPSYPLLYESAGWCVDGLAVSKIQELLTHRTKARHSVKSRKVFFRRSHTITHRRLINQDIVEVALQAEGFEIIQPELLRLDEIIALLEETALVVAPWSSALHNLMFATGGLRIVVLLPHDLRHFRGEAGSLLTFAGNDVLGITGPTAVGDHLTPYDAGQQDYSVDIPLLLDCLTDA